MCPKSAVNEVRASLPTAVVVENLLRLIYFAALAMDVERSFGQALCAVALAL